MTVMIHKLRDNATLCEEATIWFLQKWGIPVEAYQESMEQCIAQLKSTPQWYVVLDDAKRIIAGQESLTTTSTTVPIYSQTYAPCS